MKKQVLRAANISKSFQRLLEQKGYEIIDWQESNAHENIVGIVTSNKLVLNEATIRHYKQLKWIGRLGSGMEIIDTDYCHKKNIAVASSPAGIAQAVGDHCVAMLVSLQKNIASSFCEIKNRQWIREPNRGYELSGKTIGLIGYGHTARAFAKKLSGFDCKLMAYDKYKTGFGNENIEEVELLQLQQNADVISFHVPANKETIQYYDSAFIANCKKHILLNTSRGDIVSTNCLLTALETGEAEGAALDVLEKENELIDQHSKQWAVVEKLLTYNVLLTPHIAGYSHDAIEKMSEELMVKLADHF